VIELIALMLLSQQPAEPFVQGTASYYNVASSSRITASGERFEDDAFTLAMLDGEFGEYFLVVAENGRSVVCRLNDRGPYVGNRVVDLSEGAMRALHPTAGLLEVKVYRLGTRPPAQFAQQTRGS